jgi:hypothetical protein
MRFIEVINRYSVKSVAQRISQKYEMSGLRDFRSAHKTLLLATAIFRSRRNGLLIL